MPQAAVNLDEAFQGLPDIAAGVRQEVSSHYEEHAHKSNRASALGDPCTRFLVLCRTRYSEKTAENPELEFIFRTGREIERRAFIDLQERGYEIFKPDDALTYQEQALQISGKLDAKIIVPGIESLGAFPVEIKSMMPYAWEATASEADMRNSKSRFHRRYPAQLQLYMLLANRPFGLWYLVNKGTGKPKSFWTRLDLEYAEMLLKKAEVINGHITAGTLPAPTSETSLCERCAFKHVCLPDLKAQAPEMMTDDEDLIGLLMTRRENADAAKAYKKAHEVLKTRLENIPKALIGGDFLVEGKESSPRPKMVKHAEGKTYTFWDMKITDLGKKETEVPE